MASREVISSNAVCDQRNEVRWLHVEVAQPALSTYFTFQELLRGLRWRVDFTIDQHPAGISADRTLKLPRHIVSLSGKLRPVRSFFWVLLQPEMTLLVSKRPQAGTPKPVGPRVHVFKLRHYLNGNAHSVDAIRESSRQGYARKLP